MHLNIGIVTPTLARSATGTSRWVSMLCERLCDAGHCATVVTADLVLRGNGVAPAVQIDQRSHVETFPVRGSLARRVYRSTEMRRWLDCNVTSFDVVDIQGIWSFVAVDAARACMRAGTPYVITTHGQMARWDWKKRPLRKRVFYRMFLRSAWRAAAAVRFLSEGERRHSMDAAVGRSVVIPNWTKSPSDRPSDSEAAALRADLGIAADAQVILFLGRVTAQKGVVEILRAFDNLWHRRSDCVLVLAGPIDPEYRQLVEQEYRRADSRRNIRFTGPVHDERKAAVFSLATLFITVSENEGLPIAVLEALASGLPVIITEDANLPEVPLYGAGLIVSREPREVGETLDALLKVPARLRTMGQNARRLIRDCFAAEVVFPRLLSMYHQTFARGGGRVCSF